jgi:hypothetical protein
VKKIQRLQMVLPKVLIGILFGAVLSTGSFAHAILEVKASYSVLNSTPNDINQITTGMPSMTELAGFGGEVMAMLPAMPIGIGARYERLTANGSNSVGSFDSTWTRVSVVVNRRLFDTGFYLGPILTLGVSNDFKYSTTINNVTTDYKSTGNISATVGIEAGLKLSVFRLGAEAGYMYATLGDLNNNATGTLVTRPDGSSVKTDLSGPYLRATAGFGF